MRQVHLSLLKDNSIASTYAGMSDNGHLFILLPS